MTSQLSCASSAAASRWWKRPRLAASLQAGTTTEITGCQKGRSFCGNRSGISTPLTIPWQHRRQDGSESAAIWLMQPQLRLSLDLLGSQRDGRLAGPEGIGD